MKIAAFVIHFDYVQHRKSSLFKIESGWRKCICNTSQFYLNSFELHSIRCPAWFLLYKHCWLDKGLPCVFKGQTGFEFRVLHFRDLGAPCFSLLFRSLRCRNYLRTKAFLSSGNKTLCLCKFFEKKLCFIDHQHTTNMAALSISWSYFCIIVYNSCPFSGNFDNYLATIFNIWQFFFSHNLCSACYVQFAVLKICNCFFGSFSKC